IVIGGAGCGFCGSERSMFVAKLSLLCAAAMLTAARIANALKIKCFFIVLPSVAGRMQVLARGIASAHYYTSMDYLEKAGRVLDLEIFELQRLRQRLDGNFSRA